MSDCSEISPLLDAYLDGGLDPAGRARVEGHLAGCANCRAESAAIAAIARAARALPATIEPGRDLWAGIEPRLGAAPPVLVSARRGMGRAPGRYPWLQLAAALALFAAGFAAALLWRQGPAPTRLATLRAEYDSSSATLARALTDNAGALAPETRLVVERNLAIIDQAIREAERALTEDPGNAALEQMLLARYEQRLALLRRATLAGRQAS